MNFNRGATESGYEEIYIGVVDQFLQCCPG